MNKSGLCIELRELGYDCVLESFPAAVLVVIWQNGMKHILCTDEALKLSQQPKPLDLYSGLVQCEGCDWYDWAIAQPLDVGIRHMALTGETYA